MLFTHKLHIGEGAGQTSAGHRAPNTDVRADSQAEDPGCDDDVDPGGWVGQANRRRGAVRATTSTLFRLESSPEVWGSLTRSVSSEGRSYHACGHLHLPDLGNPSPSRRLWR